MTILTAIIGLAILAVLVGKNSQTAKVLDTGGTSFAAILKAAVSPVS
jgi:hypothetical protein